MKQPAQNTEPRWKNLLTSGGGSVIMHLAILALASLSLRGCQQAVSNVAGGEPFRDVGLHVVEGVDGGSAAEGTAPGAGADSQTQIAHEQSTQTDQSVDTATGHATTSERLPSEAPDITDLLNASETNSEATGDSQSDFPQLIGPGRPIGGVKRPAQGAGGQLIEPTEAGGAAKVGGVGGPGDTTFMNISGIGKTFVYVIDTSSSMHGGRLKIAQSQLKMSLRLLQPNQQFGVIFYNEHRTYLQLPGQGGRSMHFATELTKLAAAKQIDRLVSDSGTEHKPALLEALSLKPDVIYFLTDGDEPALSPADLAEIDRKSSATTIHVIKFGDGKMVSRQLSWLERLAQQSNGEFREIRAAQ